ncbi:MAG: glycerol-3-phosphate acyltransferase [Caldisericaceae bacterium]|nr:glycerol-3-phosphate acyltransferase [Caldisericaceae bacterium]
MVSLLEFSYIFISYLIGSFSPATVFIRIVKKRDVRELGDKNPGTFNTFKVLGQKWGIAVGIIDVGKGFILTLLPFIFRMPHSQETAILAGIAVVIGHSFPIYYKFRGGMGIAPIIGVLSVICWREMRWVLIIWLVLVILIVLLKKKEKRGIAQFIAFLFLIPLELFYFENIHVIIGSSVLLGYLYLRRYILKKTVF